ncbi:ATP synthase subunit I [Tahibacter amnicola]|uniref:ATP synthase subunit I n=1 Tax=Tahibacter amnicola TaxID=2976241 RepID=A0ABY6BFD0_9GAMM|nr:ATP synthase subunit I [Tahibacter amnicola]UXI68738.1 ATP synthase subunit I [Tahibacter amnicola]
MADFTCHFGCGWRKPADIIPLLSDRFAQLRSAEPGNRQGNIRVRNSIAAGRRLAARIVFAQTGVSLLMALVFLAQGARPATGAFAGGMLATCGTALLAARMFVGEAISGQGAFWGFLLGTVLKWLLLAGGLVALLGVWRFPPLAAITGFVAATLVNLAGLRFKD